VRRLRRFIYEVIVRHPELAVIEARGAAIIRALFEWLTDAKFNDRNRLLPLEFQDRLRDIDTYVPGLNEDEARVRCVADYIAGMTDTFAERRYAELRSVRRMAAGSRQFSETKGTASRIRATETEGSG